jgi:lysozyme family protein
MYSFKRAFKSLILIEGGYSNHPFDKGGETAYGVTKKTAIAFGYEEDMSEMTLEQAEEIYKKCYWDTCKGDEISGKSEVIAKVLFEIAVHRGVKDASVFFQKALNSFNKNNEYYKDIKEDGVIGSKTVEALSSLVSKRKLEDVNYVIATYMLVEHAYELNRFAEKDKNQESFMFGWYLNRIKLNWETK